MDTKRLILFVIFSFSILMLWDSWQRDNKPASTPSAVAQQAEDGSVPQAAKSSTPAANQASLPVETGFRLQSAERINVDTDLYKASIDTIGGDLRRLELREHKDDDDLSKNFLLMDDQSTPMLYVAQTGLIGNDLPTHKATFTSESTNYQLAPGADSLDVRLTWKGDNGVEVDKIYTFHRDSYAIEVSYQIRNNGEAAIDPSVYYQIVHDNQSHQGSYMMPTFTGGAYFTEADKYKKLSFSDMSKTNLSKNASDGWVGLVQHYFVSAWIPKDGLAREFYSKKLSDNVYSIGSVSHLGPIEPGQSSELKSRLYAGPQTQADLQSVAPGLEYTVDYGWLTVIASPLFWVLSSIQKLVHNWGVAIILLTILIKLAFYPLSAASYRSMANMRELAPRLQRLKEQYGDDRQKLHQAMMEMYKTEKINPMGGCLPILVQIPVFIALYWVLLGSVEMRHAPFVLWIQDLSAIDPYYVLPILMGATMIIQTKLNPKPADPIQAKVMTIMPIVFSVFFFFFPAGLVLYWLVNNILSIAQQWHINRNTERAAAKKKEMHAVDTIAAIATALGSGGIGVVRVSGPLSRKIAEGVLGHCPPPRHAAYLPFRDVDQALIDQGIAIYYVAPFSYTGEDVLELQAHGGPALMQILLKRCLGLGARQAEPGEFTRRAYLNDKLDLAQAEAVADVINAATEAAARSAVKSLSGEFSSRIHALLQQLIDLRLYVEACLDFPEEDIDFISQGRVAEKLATVSTGLEAVFREAQQGNLLREGMQVVLVGQPNVGKSSLMNQLAGEEVAIVTPIAGTTRDTIKNSIQINGVPLHIIDTAGLRETNDEVEQQGIARTWRALENAGVALLLLDAADGIGNAEKSILERLPQFLPKIWVHNKIDLESASPKIEQIDGQSHIHLSAKTGAGVELLRQCLLEIAGWQPNGEGVFMARSRHLAALAQVRGHLEIAAGLLLQPELFAEELRLAQEALNTITGEFTPDDLLGEIFSRFCIGK